MKGREKSYKPQAASYKRIQPKAKSLKLKANTLSA